ncbi:TolC family protein [Pedobacter flavus]|uniref:TolC family protein n=1 Tax=Pedobacter flavus TaxID=3113906 RepID=A0ABU7H0F8_9SPHI|nr:TolC family protein [Pedobacter sp. VNH31]MEE1884818.1 TolC family protein [Pedobacter sp. VNH31]
MSLKKNILFIALFLGAFYSKAQEKLTLNEAIQQALKNNYDIKIVNNNAEISKNNVNLGNAGMLPRLTGDASTGGGISNSVLTNSSGVERTVNGAKNTNFSYGVNLGWTLFDGFQMFTNYERLKELQKLGEIGIRTAVLNTVSDVIIGYYDLARQQKLIIARDTAIDISNFRLKLAQNKLDIGRGSKLDVLTAEVDYNADTALYLQLKNNAKQSMINLNRLMARDPNIIFEVDQQLDSDLNLNLTDLMNQAATLNPIIQNSVINNRIAELNLKATKGQKLPVVQLNSGYNFNRSMTPTGFNQQMRSNGFTYGFSASINIFNGNLQKQNERNAKIEIKNTELSLSQAKESVNAQILTAYRTYDTGKELLNLENKNVEIARQYLDITLEKYRLGSISPLDVRDAQIAYLAALTRHVEAQFQVKLNEITLKEISGTLNIQ